MCYLCAREAPRAQKPEAPLNRRAVLLACLLLSACSYLPLSVRPMPPLEEQKAHIQKNELLGQVLAPQAFLQTWGKPAYAHAEQTQFFPSGDGNWVPRFRLQLGQAPPGWDATVRYGDGLFLIYPDRGELLGFLDGRLVSREKLAADHLHAIGKVWRQEDMYQSGMEKILTVPQ